MGFRENLKNELIYTGMLVKELSAKTGIKKRTIDKYLTENGSSPSVEAAVKIARILGVSAEFLVTGQDHNSEKALNFFNSETRELIQLVETLDKNSREIMLTLGKSLKKMQDRYQELLSPLDGNYRNKFDKI
jgi:transcriptional regulator with XRE-family HTH domain